MKYERKEKKFKIGDLVVYKPERGTKHLCIVLKYLGEDSYGNIIRIYDIQNEEYDRSYDSNYRLCE